MADKNKPDWRAYLNKEWKHLEKSEFAEVVQGVETVLSSPQFKANPGEYVSKLRAARGDEEDLRLPDDAVLEVLEHLVRAGKKPEKLDILKVDGGATLQCTFVETGKVMKVQKMVHCRTCFGSDQTMVVCLPCLLHCHFGHHTTEAMDTKGFCDCGGEGKCKPSNPLLPASVTFRPGGGQNKSADMDVEEEDDKAPSADSVAANLFVALVKSDSKSPSLAHSPACIRSALSLLAYGSTGAWPPLAKFFGVAQPDELKWKDWNVPGLSQNNWFIYSPGKKPLADYEKAMQPRMPCTPFTGKVDDINSKVAKATNGLIPNLLKPSDIPANLVFIILSVLYFKMSWNRQFDPTKTKLTPFTSYGGAKRQEPLMRMSGEKYRYFEDKTTQYVELAYKNKDFVMGFAKPVQLPKSRADLALTIPPVNSFSSTKLDTLAIPKFKRQLRCSLREVLNTLGLGPLFAAPPNGAPPLFGKITNASDVWISDVIHACVVNVDEEGTEAAAATAILARSKGISRQHYQFVFDGPGWFWIRHRPSGRILFEDVFD